jgi:hypothetical protein
MTLMNKKIIGTSLVLVTASVLFIISTFSPGCRVYTFRDISIPDSIKTVKVGFFENKAPYINPQLSPRLSDRLRQKIVSQTKLSQTNNESSADWVVSGTITNYSFSTSGIANQREATNRLTVSVHVTVNDQKAGQTKEYDVSRNSEFDARKSIPEAEADLLDELIRGLTDDIFNRIFSDW